MRYLLLLFCASLGFAQFNSSAPSGAQVVQSSPNGNACTTATAKAKIYQGTIYTCQSGAYAAVSGGGGAPTGSAGGDLTGTYPNPTVVSVTGNPGTPSKVTLYTGTAPANPPTGSIRLYGDSGTGMLVCLTSGGTNCFPSGASPAGSNYQIQYYSSGALAASSNFQVDPTNKNLLLGASGAGIRLGNIIGDTTFPGIWFGSGAASPSFSNFAFLNDPSNGTILNGPSGTRLHLRINNSDEALIGDNTIMSPATDFTVKIGSTAYFWLTSTQAWWGLGVKQACVHGSNATCGVVTLSSGTATVSTTAIAALAAAGGAGDVLDLKLQSCSSCGTLSPGTVTAGTSFVVNSSNASDASKVYWEIKHVN